MKIIGIDPSSSICGIAIVDSPDTIVKVEHWKRDKARSHPQGMQDYFDWLGTRLVFTKPHMAVIEMGAYGNAGPGSKGNFQVAQTVAFYQAVSVLACKINGLVVIESRASSARKATLGNGRLSKDETWETMRKRYPDLFSAKTSGGLDECDALVLALAGERVAER